MRWHRMINEKPAWPRWKPSEACSEEELAQANLRTLWPEEIVLDLDKPKEKDKLTARLKEDSLSFALWLTGSRGVHYHLDFNELLSYSEQDRNLLRKLFIRHYGCDEAKASEKGLIAVERRPHFKTGIKKALIENHDAGINLFPAWLLKEFEDAKTKSKEAPLTPAKIDSAWLKGDPILQYVLNHTIPEGTHRHSVLLKNLGIALVQTGLPDSELEPYVDRIIRNCPGKKPAELWSWIKGAREGRYLNYNQAELVRWLRTHKEVLP